MTQPPPHTEFRYCRFTFLLSDHSIIQATIFLTPHPKEDRLIEKYKLAFIPFNLQCEILFGFIAIVALEKKSTLKNRLPLLDVILLIGNDK